MSLVTAKEIINRVKVLINDITLTRWTKVEVLDYLNDAQRAIVIRRPDAYTVDDDDFPCVAGTKQRLPDEALRLIEITRNKTGNVIRGPFDRNVLDTNYPNWHTVNTATSAELFLYDERNPKTFYLYPGVADGVLVTAVYSKAPPLITEAMHDADQVISLDDIYMNAIIEWILYRCYMKDAEFAANPNKSLMHQSAFKTQLGEKSQADGAMAGQEIKE